MESFKIVNFELSMNRLFFMKPIEVVQAIFLYAVGEQAKRMATDSVVSDYDIMKQFYIFYIDEYRKEIKTLPSEITDEIETIEDFYPDVEHCGFRHGEFCPDEQIDSLLDYANTHPSFLEKSRKFYYFHLVFTGVTKFSFCYVKDYFSEFKKCKKEGLFPYEFQISTSLPKNFLLEQRGASKRELALAAMYSAIRSIVGSNVVARTNREFILMRMLGARNKREHDELLTKFNVLAQAEHDYNPTHHEKKFTGMLDELRRRKLISWYGDKSRRCTWISLKSDEENFSQAIADAIKKEGKETRNSRLRTMIQEKLL